MQTTRIITSHDYDNVITELVKIKRGDTDGFLKRIDPSGNLVINVAQLNNQFECDVLIVEDNPEHILIYLRALERFPYVKHIIVCTKKIALELTLEYIQELDRIKLVILDFDLDTTLNTDDAALNALTIYNLICDKITAFDLKVIGITGFENNYDSRNYKILESEMRKRHDDVYSKKVLNSTQKEILENILRNVTAIHIDWDIRPKKEAKPIPVEQALKMPVENVKQDSPSPFNQRKISAAKHLLDRLNNAVVNFSKEQVAINYSDKNFLKLIPNKNGQAMQYHNSLAGVVETKKEVINYLLKSSEYKDEWKPLRYQIQQGMFSKQLQ